MELSDVFDKNKDDALALSLNRDITQRKSNHPDGIVANDILNKGTSEVNRKSDGGL